MTGPHASAAIAQAIELLPARTAILDGEAVAIDRRAIEFRRSACSASSLLIDRAYFSFSKLTSPAVRSHVPSKISAS
jgi:hypothetical protein